MKQFLLPFLASLILMSLNLNGNVIRSDQVEQFYRDGFLVVENFISSEECETLKRRMSKLLEEFDPQEVQAIFTTDEQQRYADEYFLTSADKIRFFFEKDAFLEDGTLRYTKERCINKAAHALHECDPVFSQFSRQQKLQELAADLGLVDPVLIQSMYIFKQPRIGGEVNWHQDATFLYVEPQSVVGFWFALEDATLENGCLWAIPGGHKSALKKRYVCDESGQCSFEEYDPTDYDTTAMVPLQAKKGTLIVIHGMVPHMSCENQSEQSRHAYTMHLYDGRSTWSKRNWLQRSEENPAMGF